jgi:hypothetical protein
MREVEDVTLWPETELELGRLLDGQVGRLGTVGSLVS